MSATVAPPSASNHLQRQELRSVTIRFAGDSGDGMQLTGQQFTDTSALFGNDVSTLPDFPAEIRAPIGTTYGVSGFQLQFSATDIFTPGDEVDTFVAMNPASLKTNIKDVREGGIVITNTDAFTEANLKLAGYASNPIEDGSLKNYQVFSIPMTKATREAVEKAGLKTKDADRCRNLYALGLVYWLYNRPIETTMAWLKEKFKKKPEVAEANILALKAGYYFGETAELFTSNFEVPKAELTAGKYRKMGGNEATALGLVAAGQLAKKTVFYASYPITPASDILHELSALRQFDVVTFQAEDEIAAIASAIGAAYGGVLSVTGTSGPGLALKIEAVNLAMMIELPLVIIDVQRGGPSTGLPTKTEATDLQFALHGRPGEAPLPVVAAQSPGDCFYIVLEAARIAMQFMTPVIVLTDGYLGNGAEPWLVPDIKDLPDLSQYVKHPTEPNSEDGRFLAYKRDKFLARPWAVPGTPGLQHRVGGLEKADITGNVNYEPENHQHMTNVRAKKVENIAETIPDLVVEGDKDGGDLLVLGWGGTWGHIREAVRRCRSNGMNVSQAHLRYMNPMPKNTEKVLKSFKKILIPELNMGQLAHELRGKYMINSESLCKVKGRPFMVSEIVLKIEEMLAAR